MSEKMRDSFESYVRDIGLSMLLSRSSDGNWYCSDQIDEMWTTWQASRAALVVELPKAVHINITERRILLENDVIDQLESCGVKHK